MTNLNGNEFEEVSNKIKSDKKLAESYVVLSMYKDIDLYMENNIKLETFNHKVWKFYFMLLQKAVEKGYRAMDSIVIGSIVEGLSDSDKSKYAEYGDYTIIENGLDIINPKNFDTYLQNMNRANSILKVSQIGFKITAEAYKALCEKSVDEIQQAYESSLAKCFDGLESGEKIEDLTDGLMKMIEEADAGVFKGLPYASKLLNYFTNGQALGNITMLSANSGVGKTFMAVAQVLPTFIKNELGVDKLTILANEEDSRKWKQAIVTWVANNVFDFDFNKNRFMQGSFTKEEMSALKQSVEWYEDKVEKGCIEFVGFSSFSMKKAIKLIKKQKKTKGTEYFILDTLKSDSTAKESEQVWLHLQNNMVHLFDAIKSQTNNVHVFVTYQLGKSAMQRKYLDQSSLGVSKNVVDVVSTLLLARKAHDSEKRKEGEESGLQVREIDNEGIVKYMRADMEYFIVFMGKNRHGETSRQMVFEVDMGKNIMKDFGFVSVDQDF